MSNHDLYKWINKLRIKHFRDIFSRDNLLNKIKRLETGIIDLDDSIAQGTHWVAYRNIDKLVYSTDEIQDRDSVLCGYWCLYYLLERQKGRSILDVIHNAKFSFTDQMINHRFIIHYFKNI